LAGSKKNDKIIRNMFNFGKKLTLGLDLSDFSLKFVQLEKNKKGFSLINCVKEDLPVGLIQRGEIKKEKELTNIIKGALRKIKRRPFGNREVVCSLPEEKVFIRVIQLPLMKEEELGQAVGWEAEAHIPLNINEVYFDWQIIKRPVNQSDHYNILVGAAPRFLVDSYFRFLKRSGLKPIALEPESVAVSRSLIKVVDLTPTILVDLGASGTNFVILSASALYFTSHISISGQLFNRAIMESLGINEKKAEQLKIEVGLDKAKEKGKVYQALKPLVEELVNQIKDYTAFYQNQSSRLSRPDGVIGRVLLCGGDSLLNNCPSFLEQKLGLTIEIGNPLVNLPGATKGSSPKLSSLSKKEILTYTTALGLAMRNLED